MAGIGHVHAQLVSPSGHRLQRKPGETLAGLIDDGIIGHGMVGAVIAMPGRHHFLALGPFGLSQPG